MIPERCSLLHLLISSAAVMKHHNPPDMITEPTLIYVEKGFNHQYRILSRSGSRFLLFFCYADVAPHFGRAPHTQQTICSPVSFSRSTMSTTRSDPVSELKKQARCTLYGNLL